MIRDIFLCDFVRNVCVVGWILALGDEGGRVKREG